ncbi:MAG: PQQ-binding-like beta-propeller repeat protein [Flavobacteriales bacterium]
MRYSAILLFSLILIAISCKKEKTGDDNSNSNSNNNNNNSGNNTFYIEHTFQPGNTGFDYNSPIIKDDFLYIGTSKKLFSDVSSDNAFYKFDLQLNVIWKYALDSSEVRGSAALDSDNNIYFTVQEGRKYGDMSQSKLYVYSLNNSGTFRWKKLIASGSEIKDVGAYELAAGTHIYIQGNSFYAINRSNGNEAWRKDMTGGVSRPILDINGNIYLVNFGAFVSYDSTGTKRWSYIPSDNFTENGDAFSNPSFASADQSKIVFFYDTWLYNINSADGSFNWKYNAPFTGYQRGTPALDHEGNIYVGRKNHNNPSAFYKVNKNGNAVVWADSSFGEIYTCPVLANDSNVYFASELLNNGPGKTPGWNRLHVLNINTGKIIWQADLGSDVGTSSPAMSNTGRIYAGTIGYEGSPSKLVCVKTSAGGTLAGAIHAQFGD